MEARLNVLWDYDHMDMEGFIELYFLHWLRITGAVSSLTSLDQL